MDGINGRWLVVETIGSGGQGDVQKVIDLQRVRDPNGRRTRIAHLVGKLTGNMILDGNILTEMAAVEALVADVTGIDSCYGALKRLKKDATAKARDRMAKEISALSKVEHANLASILDHDGKEGWFVTQFYRRGTLSDTVNMSQFTGEALKSLQAVRGIVDALSAMFKAGLIHRDVKPANIFVAGNGALVLGDLGLVFDLDAEGRLSSTTESAGTADWMAPWAANQRLEETTFKLDVYGIGKVLYCMISGKKKLAREYHRRDEGNLEGLFPASPGMREVNALLDQCVVESEQGCTFKSHLDFIAAIDTAIHDISRERPNMLDKMEGWKCQVCKRGQYKVKDYDPDVRATREEIVLNLGFRKDVDNRKYKVGICNACGHMALFTWCGNTPPSAWKEQPG
jgi:serine/threonine protein kinase